MRLLVPLIALVLLAGPTAAYQEAEAESLWQQQYGGSGVLATDHAPRPVYAGDQFGGTLHLAPDHNISEVHYQVCIVADQCIISPRPATQENATAWTFDTQDFRLPEALGGGGHEWGAGDWIGIQWFVRFQGDEELHAFPRPIPSDAPECSNDPVGCQESHYFTFHVLETAGHDAPGPASLLGVALLVLAGRRRG